ncbi:hypothetical protein FDA09_04110 [Clostridium botulinum]|uniref:anti sigma factor C-terminal domain-containing protein n=1 Tax=Clostridium botulinum TaxID=1491 RepID=UPI0007736CA9|nr:anti sigma factor C-terminal domain-containing protein [Clostridium botulinum]NFH78587.1 hypothetical protein [Clostridium botulinum]NFH83284.1 hypothetical protein [Clostridium botulinum]NFI10578.1 hypothetical protein [Clostridium botulinum]NFI13133.1 hypothetical protein [Clostridium botulinum]NFO82851.1 hypothetical protein [Clostridium botulinum]
MKNLEDNFNEENIKKDIRKAKFKLIIKVVSISIIVLLIGGIINLIICAKYSTKSYENNDIRVQLSIPNGYISKSDDIFGFFGGNGTYKISKDIGGKPIVLEECVSRFGLLPFFNCYRGCGGGYHNSGQWSVSLWENGYKKMRFFHPELQYKEYQNDLEKVDSIPDDKIIEMAISFDRPYKIMEMYLPESQLRDVKVTWLWLDEFTENKMNEFQNEINKHDAKANGIMENEVLGIGFHDYFMIDKNSYNYSYDELINTLSNSKDTKYKELYEEIMKKGKTSADDAKILGAIVQGKKEDLTKLVGNPLIKSSSFGVITEELY